MFWLNVITQSSLHVYFLMHASKNGNNQMMSCKQSKKIRVCSFAHLLCVNIVL